MDEKALEESIEQIADEMYKMVEEAAGKRSYKPGDLVKAMMTKFDADKKTCKTALRSLMDSGRCVYGYFGGTSVQLPHKEGAANDKRMLAGGAPFAGSAGCFSLCCSQGVGPLRRCPSWSVEGSGPRARRRSRKCEFSVRA